MRDSHGPTVPGNGPKNIPVGLRTHDCLLHNHGCARPLHGRDPSPFVAHALLATATCAGLFPAKVMVVLF